MPRGFAPGLGVASVLCATSGSPEGARVRVPDAYNTLGQPLVRCALTDPWIDQPTRMSDGPRLDVVDLDVGVPGAERAVGLGAPQPTAIRMKHDPVAFPRSPTTVCYVDARDAHPYL